MATVAQARQFLFISNNKSDKTPAGLVSQGQVRSLIRSHAARTQNNLVAASSTLSELVPASIRVEKRRKKRRQRNGTIRLEVRKAESEVDIERENDGAAGTKQSTNAGGVSFAIPPIETQYAMSRVLEGGWTGPFSSLNLPTGLYVPLVIDHYLTYMTIPIPELDAGTTGILYKKWFPMVLTDTAVCHVIILFAASHYLSFRQKRDSPPLSAPSLSSQAMLLSIKQQTLQRINESIRDPKRAISDTTIAAVAKMASYEAIFGDGRVYATHMAGLSRMLALRGGLAGVVDALDGLLARMIVWIDCNAAYLLGTKLNLAQVAQPLKEGGFVGRGRGALPVPDPASFLAVPKDLEF